jgi:inner membrane protein
MGIQILKKLKKKDGISSLKKINLYTSVIYVLVLKTTREPQFAFSYEFIATESELKAVEVPK